MSTPSTSQKGSLALISREASHRKRKIVKLFYSEASWRLYASRDLSEKEINEVIRRIAEFYAGFLKERRKELETFGFEVDFDREANHFRLRVTLSSADYIPTNAFAPPCIELPMDQLSSENIKLHMATSKKTTETGSSNGQGKPKGSPTSVDPTLQTITVKAYDSTPTQNTGSGGKTPPPTKD